MFLSSPYSSRLFLIFSIFPLSRDISGHQCLAVRLGEASSINKTKPKTRTQLFNDHILLAEKQSGSISKLNGMERKDFWNCCHHVCHGGIFLVPCCAFCSALLLLRPFYTTERHDWPQSYTKCGSAPVRPSSATWRFTLEAFWVKESS